MLPSNVAGNYKVHGGLTIPYGFQGRVIVGTSGTDKAEYAVNPVEHEPIAALLDSVTSAVAPTTTAFVAEMPSAQSMIGGVIAFQTGTLRGLARRVTSHNTATGLLGFTIAWPAAPTIGDQFIYLGRIDD